VRKFNQTILRTLAYADVFDYPLTAEETKKYAIAPVQSIELPRNQKYFYLPGREKIVQLRKLRQKWSLEKIKIAQQTAGWLRIIPWVKMVGITGALAMNNSPSNDDIDLLIVTAKKRLWLTRLLAVLLIELIGQRRRPGDHEFKNKICLNIFLSEEILALPVKERNLYTAHEVVQVKKIWERDGVHRRFLQANEWVGGFLPNAVRKFKSLKVQGFNKLNKSSPVLDFWEKIAKEIQWRYMKRKITKEKVEDRRLMFHPHDLSEKILGEYQKHLDKLKAAN
jgi:hypothetical protein